MFYKYFKDADGNLFGLLLDGSQDSKITSDMVQLDAAEVENLDIYQVEDQ